jgi:hypothetical protein
MSPKKKMMLGYGTAVLGFIIMLVIIIGVDEGVGIVPVGLLMMFSIGAAYLGYRGYLEKYKTTLPMYMLGENPKIEIIRTLGPIEVQSAKNIGKKFVKISAQYRLQKEALSMGANAIIDIEVFMHGRIHVNPICTMKGMAVIIEK